MEGYNTEFPGKVKAESFEGNATSAEYAKLLTGWADTRSIGTKPNDYNEKLLPVGIKQNTATGIPDGGTYATLVGIRGWKDSSGGKAHEIGFTANGKLYHRVGDADTWEPWRELAHMDDSLPANALENYWINTSNGTYRFMPSGGKMISNNKGVKSSTAESTWKGYFRTSSPFTLKYRVSSESNYDKLTITLDGMTIVNAISGDGSEKTYTATLSEGVHTLYAKYVKDSSTDKFEDRAFLEFANVLVSYSDIADEIGNSAAVANPMVTGTLPIANGGTGATNVADARANLGIQEVNTVLSGADFNDITKPGLYTMNSTSGHEPYNGDEYYGLIVLSSTGNSSNNTTSNEYVQQIAISEGSGKPRVAIRGKDGSWGDWYEVQLTKI